MPYTKQAKLKTYRVGLSEVVSGYATIKATNAEEAETKAQRLLNAEGVSGFKDFDSTHRECIVLDVGKDVS